MICFSSPFDRSAIDFLEEINNPIYKIASFEITDIDLIEYAASKGKPMIISTGIADYNDIKLAVDTCRNVGNNDITLLKCTSSYPAPVNEANLIMMNKFAKDFNVTIGLSDHTLGIEIPIVATSLGAKVIEKHFILNNSIGGPDAAFSLDEKDFAQMVKSIRIAELAIGNESYDLTDKQIKGKQFARSLYISNNVKAGDVVSSKNVRSVRPGYGLHPKYLKDILGKKFKSNMDLGSKFSLDDIE